MMKKVNQSKERLKKANLSLSQLGYDNLPFLQNNPELALLEEIYNPSDTDSFSGNYILSNFRTLGIKRIRPQITRVSVDGYFKRTSKYRYVFINIIDTPGPGSYVIPSEFGTL